MKRFLIFAGIMAAVVLIMYLSSEPWKVRTRAEGADCDVCGHVVQEGEAYLTYTDYDADITFLLCFDCIFDELKYKDYTDKEGVTFKCDICGRELNSAHRNFTRYTLDNDLEIEICDRCLVKARSW